MFDQFGANFFVDTILLWLIAFMHSNAKSGKEILGIKSHRFERPGSVI
jgi:hypothetical protein